MILTMSLRAAVIVLFGFSQACASASPSVVPNPSPTADQQESTLPPVAAVQRSAAAGERDDVLIITERAVLHALEARGYGLGELLDGARAGDNAALAASPGYESIARVLEGDIRRAAQADPLAGTSVAQHAHRLFNSAWLRAQALRFELVGVVNRLDRRPFHQKACGELRLVYRLSYSTDRTGEPLASRLPLTIGLEFPMPAPDARDSCAEQAARWRVPRGLAAEQLTEWLAGDGGPLRDVARSASRDLLIVANLQVVRWPSTIRPDMSGHAEYVLRAFRRAPDGVRFRPAPLENSPDVPRLRNNPALRRELLAWIFEEKNLARIDEGTALVPERFLTTVDVSVTPRGLGRRANRPYRRLFRAADFADLDLGKRRFARSPEALLRRLDDLTCVGCHQSRSIAGFHLLGDDDASTPLVNSLREPTSVHLLHDLERRGRVLFDLGAQRQPDYARPFAERTRLSDGAYGAHCGLGDPGFSDWSCAAGLRCDAYDAPADDRVVGVCFPVTDGEVGDPCEVGTLAPNDNPHRDRVGHAAKRACARSGCIANRVGFPGGMCTAACEDLPAPGACGAIAVLDAFNACIARREPFARCIEQHHTPTGLRRCDANMPCRDDYICARSTSGDGICIPPYFLFQLRVDGHPN
jgi:hypothetical protein